MQPEIIKEMYLRDPKAIPPPFDHIVDKIGIDAFIIIVNAFAGTNVYFPSAKSIFKDNIEDAMAEEFNGVNAGDLAKKFSYTVKAVQRVLRKNRPEERDGCGDIGKSVQNLFRA